MTRPYLPTADAGVACQRCWGLSYPSQKQSYVSGGFLFELLGSWGKSETAHARKRRRVAAQKRYAERGTILAGRASTAVGVGNTRKRKHTAAATHGVAVRTANSHALERLTTARSVRPWGDACQRDFRPFESR